MDYVAVVYVAVTLTIEAYVIHDVWSNRRRGGSVGYHYFPDVVWVLAWPLGRPDQPRRRLVATREGEVMRRIFNVIVAAYLGWACVRNAVSGDALWAAISAIGFLASLFNFALESRGY